MAIMRTFLICHQQEMLNRVGLARWLASFSQLTGILVLEETAGQKRRRIIREIKRLGPLRFLDVLAFRLYYAAFLRRNDHRWEQRLVAELCERYPEVSPGTPVLISNSPNTQAAREFISNAAPDLMIARCKTLLKEEVFSIPVDGTFVMHPGICPEYRNSHGCFWALSNNDLTRVGMTLLRIDRGVDTGPVFGYYSCRYDERNESHIVIQHRTVFDNLDALTEKLISIHEKRAHTIDVQGRRSAAWGQPWLTTYLRWKRAARSRHTG
jgi:Formyl transferase